MSDQYQMPNPVQATPEVHALLDRLHQLSLDQEKSIEIGSIPKEDFDNFMRDKFIALDQDKCWFIYQLILAMGAKNVVEVGTSFGVSTIYLALAIQKNLGISGGSGKVIATEFEASKAAIARGHWKEAGVGDVIDLREGDLRETLKEGLPTIDVVVLDIWAPMTVPALTLLEPHLRPGAVVLCDNSISSAKRYKDLQEYMRAPDSGYTNLTVPYSKGLEMSVFVGRG